MTIDSGMPLIIAMQYTFSLPSMSEPYETQVLVVDDSALDRALLKLHLTNDGYKPDFATNGGEAMAKLEQNPEKYDVVLLDRRMPDIDGLTVLSKMKEHPRLRMIPVILQTAATEPKDVIEGIRTGAWYYLTKPYDSQMLPSVVRAAANDYADQIRTWGGSVFRISFEDIRDGSGLA